MKFAHLTGDVKAWAKRLVDDLNRSGDPVAALPFAVDDTAAAASGIPLGAGYRAGDGTIRWRRA